MLVPGAKLNASFAASMPNPGDLALISQSGAIAAGLVEWSATRAIGFSAVVSLGDGIDVDFGDLLDFFALDRATRAILLYVESIKDARKFMSAARAAARAKPVVVVKSGRHRQGAKAAMTHTGALAGADAVYDAAFRRAGLLRVIGLDELFAAAETLGQVKAFPGKRLAILTNGGGIGVLAVDRLADLGGVLAEISPDIMQRLDAAMPPIWSRANPIDIAGDADGARYAAAFEALLDDPGNDAVLVMNVPTALASATDAAQAIVERRPRASQPDGGAQAGIRGLGRRQRRRRRYFRACRHSRLCDRSRRGRRLHASGALPGGAGSLDGDAAQHAGGFRARPGRRPRRDRGRARGRRFLARSDRGHAAFGRLRDSGRPRPVGARPRRGRGRGRPVAAGRIDRGGQDPVARTSCTSPRWAACA